MTDKELVEALRNCAKQTDCMLCGLYNHGDCYPERKLKIAADTVERLLHENKALRQLNKSAQKIISTVKNNKKAAIWLDMYEKFCEVEK